MDHHGDGRWMAVATDTVEAPGTGAVIKGTTLDIGVEIKGDTPGTGVETLERTPGIGVVVTLHTGATGAETATVAAMDAVMDAAMDAVMAGETEGVDHPAESTVWQKLTPPHPEEGLLSPTSQKRRTGMSSV